MSLIFGSTIFKILSRTTPHDFHNISSFRPLSLFKRKEVIRDVSPYVIVRACKEEFDAILGVMQEAYYTEEPTCSSLDVTANPILDERALRAMSEGYTLVAKCKYDGSIVGACVNESTHPWDPDMDEKLACSIKNENVKKLILFYAYMMRAPDLWRCLGVLKVYEMTYLFIKRAHRKKGLAYRLLQESKMLGADSGFQVIRCDATSLHTSKICEHLGMQKVAEIPYCSYLDQNLEPIFKPPWPHESVKIYCDCAPQFNELHKKIKKKSGKFRMRLVGIKEKPNKEVPVV